MSSRCLSWEQWEEETWTDSVTLNVTLEGGNLASITNRNYQDREKSNKQPKELFI